MRRGAQRTRAAPVRACAARSISVQPKHASIFVSVNDRLCHQHLISTLSFSISFLSSSVPTISKMPASRKNAGFKGEARQLVVGDVVNVEKLNFNNLNKRAFCNTLEEDKVSANEEYYSKYKTTQTYDLIDVVKFNKILRSNVMCGEDKDTSCPPPGMEEAIRIFCKSRHR